MGTYRRMLLITVIALAGCAGDAWAEIRNETANGFTVTHAVVLADKPEAVYDATTGDISAWWDHSFADKPVTIAIEAKPGGRFYEIFDDQGNGAVHAIVTWAERGKRLRFIGQLGLSGESVQLVCTYDYEAHESGTKLTLTCNAFGVLDPGWSKAVDAAWHHFLVERLQPYIADGKHKKRATKTGT